MLNTVMNHMETDPTPITMSFLSDRQWKALLSKPENDTIANTPNTKTERPNLMWALMVEQLGQILGRVGNNWDFIAESL